MRIVLLFLISIFFLHSEIRSTELAKPSKAQYEWHEQERIMFVCLDPCTWQGREYDNHSVPLERINPEELNTDQWCEVALSWSAEEILFVAKHTGGFCWWRTETTDYGIKDTPYKNGKGDVLKELSESCEKYGLNLGIYVYPGDETWGAGIGSGGRTKDPSKQEAYNKVFRQQLTEVLSNYGDVLEVWFDGSCIIEVGDILDKYAENSVIFQGPHATIRWAGTESGKLFYPAWNTLKYDDLKTGVSTQVHGDPDGDVWAPLEANTTLYDHYWFWSPEKAEKQKSLEELMNCYYKSVGHGSVFLLNSTPDTTGLIPENDVMLYQEFGQEINRRFGTPLGETGNQSGRVVTLSFPDNEKVNHIITMEDYREGQCIRSYELEAFNGEKWEKIAEGQSVGRMKIDYFPEIIASNIRIKIIDDEGIPLIRRLAAFYVEDFVEPTQQPIMPYSNWINVASFNKNMFVNGRLELTIDLSDNINIPGQYTVMIETDSTDINVEILNADIYYEGNKALNEFMQISQNVININRTAQVTDESSSVLYITIKCSIHCSGKVFFKPKLIY